MASYSPQGQSMDCRSVFFSPPAGISVMYSCSIKIQNKVNVVRQQGSVVCKVYIVCSVIYPSVRTIGNAYIIIIVCCLFMLPGLYSHVVKQMYRYFNGISFHNFIHHRLTIAEEGCARILNHRSSSHILVQLTRALGNDETGTAR